MPYVLEYTSLRYRRRRARRNVFLSCLAAAALLGLLVWNWVAEESAKPTFHQIVHAGFTEKGRKVESLKTLAGKLFSFHGKWEEAVDRQSASMPYFRLVWSEVPLTNVVSEVVRILSSWDDSVLEPTEFAVAMEKVPPGRARAHWCSPNGGYAKDLVATVRWRTIAPHDDRTASDSRSVLSNLFAKAADPVVSSNATVSRVEFPPGNTEGLDVVSEYRFPTVRLMPVPANLGKTVEDLRAFSKELAAIEVLPREGEVGAKNDLQTVFDAFAMKDKTDRPKPFADTMDPGDWLATAGPPFVLNALQLRVVDEWTKRTKADRMWQRGFQKRIMGSSHYVNPASLADFLSGLPAVEDVKKVSKRFEDLSVGFTNAIGNVRFFEFDADRYTPVEPHATSNLLELAWGSGLVPTNGILGRSPEGGPATNGSLVLLHSRKPLPTAGIPVSDAVSKSGERWRCDFAEWTFACESSGDEPVATLESLAEGLPAFASSGQGYAPRSVAVSLGKGRGAVRVRAEGLLPLLFSVKETKEP